MIKNLSLQLGTRDPCRGQCVMESRCLSINIGPPINDRAVCELSDSDHSLHPEDLKQRTGFTYTATEVNFIFQFQRYVSGIGLIQLFKTRQIFSFRDLED